MKRTLSLPLMRCVQAMNEANEAATPPVVGMQARGVMSRSRKALTKRDACRRRVLRYDAAVEGRLFGLDADAVWREPGGALVHPYERDAGLLLQRRGHQQHLAYGGVLQIGDVEPCDDLVHQLLCENPIVCRHIPVLFQKP